MLKKNIQVNQTNTVALNLTISLIFEMMIRHLDLAFNLEITRVEELSMHFFYVKNVYGMYANNRRNMLKAFCDDLLKSNLMALTDLNQDMTTKWKQKRKKMTNLQRYLCDQAELY